MERFELIKAEIENFKGIEACVIECPDSGHILLRGVNGSNKTSIIEALVTALGGKDYLPDDPIRRGAKESIIEADIKAPDKSLYHVRCRIADGGDNFKIDITLTNSVGAKLKVSKPVSFLESIVGPIAFNPQKFGELSDAEQLEQIWSMAPGLKDALAANDTEYEKAKKERAGIAAKIDILEADLARTPYTEGVADKEIDPATLLSELQTAEKHNLQMTQAANDLKELDKQADAVETQIASIGKERLAKLEMIEELQKAIARLDAEEVKLKERVVLISQQQTSRAIFIAEFQPVDIAPINESINQCSETNAKIRKNIEHNRLVKEVEEQKSLSSAKLSEMKRIESKRADIMDGANLPIPGLIIKDGALWYPDPKTLDLRKLNSLSEGEKWPVFTRIHAAFNPKLGIMFLHDFAALDNGNRRALFAAAKEHHLKMFLHETVQNGDGLQIVVLDENGNHK